MDEAAFAAHYAEIATRVAAEDSRRLTLPAKPEDYKVELPKDFTPPVGVEFKFNEADPLLAQARTVAHELGIPQEGFQKLLGLYAGAQVASEAQITAARQAEIAKLGPTGPSRVDAVTRWAEGVLGKAEGQQLASRMFTASDVQIFERLISKSTGSGTFKSTGREPPQAPGRLTADEVAKMSLPDQLAYARRFDQKQLNGARR